VTLDEVKTVIRQPRRYGKWLMAYKGVDVHRKHPWGQVMCLTGVDYFSTLGYQPGIAALAAGVLSPVATFMLVLLTLFGALPIYRRVAVESPNGEGSIFMLERLFKGWSGLIFVLCLLGFVATDFIITITLSAADATAHIAENPFMPEFNLNGRIVLTLLLITALGLIFLKGFREAIGLAVLLVAVYLSINFIVIAVGLYQIMLHPAVLRNWLSALLETHGNPWLMVGVAFLLFPRLALGLSGFETGVAVMPLVKGSEGETDDVQGRIRNTRKLLLSAALIMSLFLITSSFVATLLIPHEEFAEGGEANGRALAYLAHLYLGEAFGTAYDLSTIAILWFAGASAMAGLLNIVPRYLPRYGMAPEWTGATRPLVVIYTLIAIIITLIFQADVEAQGGAYATGVLVLMSSAAIAVTVSISRRATESGLPFGKRLQAKAFVYAFGAITLVFLYTTVANIIERPDGIKIASFFISAIILASIISRIYRATEIRVKDEDIVFDRKADRIARQDNLGNKLHLVAHNPNGGEHEEYIQAEAKARRLHHFPKGEPIVFVEVVVVRPHEFTGQVRVEGHVVGGYHILRCYGIAIPNILAAISVYLWHHLDSEVHLNLEMSKGNPFKHAIQFILFGRGDTGRMVSYILENAIPQSNGHLILHVALKV
jgi:hypothetical protein